MNRTLALSLATLAMTLVTPALAGPRDSLLAGYAAAAKAANPAFGGFSPERGKALHAKPFAGGKPDTPACTSCHGTDALAAGRTPAGKAIDPVAVSRAPSRYTDPAKVEKWFKRNCIEVMGRECTPQEKGDWLAYVSAL